MAARHCEWSCLFCCFCFVSFSILTVNVVDAHLKMVKLVKKYLTAIKKKHTSCVSHPLGTTSGRAPIATVEMSPANGLASAVQCVPK